MAAFKAGVTTGRGGKGSIYMWAAGNGRSAMDNCKNKKSSQKKISTIFIGNYDGYSNNRYTIPVGAIVNNGRYSSYSEPCSALYCVVPSSGGANGGIPSTSTNNQCTSSFGGTSAASPLMAGVVALMLEANPTLTWRDVQHVIAASAVKVSPSDPEWVTNGGGFNHSHNYVSLIVCFVFFCLNKK
jgi:kexin